MFLFHSTLEYNHSIANSFTQSYAGGFLTFKPNIPKNLLLDGEHNVESHFALVNYQVCACSFVFFTIFVHGVVKHVFC